VNSPRFGLPRVLRGDPRKSNGGAQRLGVSLTKKCVEPKILISCLILRTETTKTGLNILFSASKPAKGVFGVIFPLSTPHLAPECHLGASSQVVVKALNTHLSAVRLTEGGVSNNPSQVADIFGLTAIR
jgi:hypothetical protein